MALSSLLQNLNPNSAADFAAKDELVRQEQALNAAKLQQAQLQSMGAQDEIASKRRSLAVSMLGGIANEPDPSKQASLYATLRPMAERYDPSLKLPDTYDPSLTNALMGSMVSPEKLLAMNSPQEMTPYQQASIDALNERNAIQREKMSAASSGKALTATAIKDLEKKAVGFEDMTRLSTGFKPEFAGNTITGGLENFAGRIGGETLGLTDPGQTQWWQDYQGYINQVRNDLFGAALTTTEKAEFEKAIVTPNMDANEAAKNLARQQAITQNALARAGGVYAKGGYNADQIGEYVPEGLSRVDTASPTINRKGKTRIIDFNSLPE